MRSAPAIAVALFLALSPLAAAAARDEYQLAVRTIRCDCGCHPQSLEDCACGYAADRRQEIAAMIEAPDGSILMTGAEVVAKFVAEKGEQILIAPKASGFNLFAWLGPLGALAGGLLLSIYLIRHLGRRGAAAEPIPAGPASVAPPAAEDADYRERLRRQLEEWD